jgi:hypothetical protein
MAIMESIARFAVDVALKEAKSGVFENANDNRGTRIDLYASAANGVMGEAWCAKFVYWCYSQAAATLGVGNPMPKIFGAKALEVWAKRQNKLYDTPAAGDVLIKEHRHAGLVTGPATAAGTFPSVEGNTWAGTTFAKRREGVYVLSNEKVASCTFIRFA